MTIEQFGEIMDDFIKKNDIQMIIRMRPGTTESEIIDNVGMGSVVQLYIILNSIETVYRDMLKQMEIEHSDGLLEGLLDLVRASCKGERNEER